MHPHTLAARAMAAAFCLMTLAGCGGSSKSSSSASTSTGTTTQTGPGAPPSPPATPTGAVSLAAAAGSGGGCVTIAWSASGLASPTFDVVRTVQGTPTTLLARSSQTAYVDTGLTPSVSYTYQIVAHANDGTQASSLAQKVVVFGPVAAGLTGTPVFAGGPDTLFRAAACVLATSATRADTASNYFTIALTLNRNATLADLQSIQYQQSVYNRTSTSTFASGITLAGRTLTFDSRAAGITLDPAFRPVVSGGFYTLIATVGGKPFQMTAPAAMPGVTPSVTTITDTVPRTFTFSVTNNL